MVLLAEAWRAEEANPNLHSPLRTSCCPLHDGKGQLYETCYQAVWCASRLGVCSPLVRWRLAVEGVLICLVMGKPVGLSRGITPIPAATTAFWTFWGRWGKQLTHALNEASLLPYYLDSPQCSAVLWWASHFGFIPGGLYTWSPCHQSAVSFSKSLSKPMLLIISLSIQTEQSDKSLEVLTTGKIAAPHLWVSL